MQQRFITSGLNHLKHLTLDGIEQKVDDRRSLTKEERARIAANYPNYIDYPTPESIYKEVGGMMYKEYLKDPEKYKDTCAMRMSIAFEKSGIYIGGDYNGTRGLKYYASATSFYKALEKRFLPQEKMGYDVSQYGVVTQHEDKDYIIKVFHVDIIFVKDNKGGGRQFLSRIL
ncbi:T6SS effector amidase Tae4 family protein [Myroides injenensis]|uniref:T6SS effector amidase Tae4 family protein n=1 Tax=Myroides injenensis TaxID=1183151 RepID=UPI00028A2EEC|nr:T6SS effector amidase Tae4 family protein [Myroides injenensis]